MLKNAVMYCRVSTKEQVEEGNSLSSQEKNCKEYIVKNGDILIQSFIEKGESAKTAKRTQLNALFKYCSDRSNKVDYVVIYKIDRIARHSDDYSAIRVKLKQFGVGIKSTTEFFEDTPAGRFMENMIATVAQFDNDVRAERCAGGMRDAMREGRYVWCASVGYKNAKINGKSNIVKDEQAPMILELFEDVALNMYSVFELKRKFDLKGLVNKSGKRLSKSQYYRLLKNKLYAGWIIKFKECHRGLFEPIVTDELFEQVQRVLRYRKRNGSGYNVDNEDFPLRCFFRHPEGHQLTGSWVKGKLRKYPYYNYHIKMKGHIYPKDKLNSLFQVILNKHALREKHYKALKIALHENLTKSTIERQNVINSTKQKIEDLKTRQQLLIDKSLNGTISDSLLKQQLENIEEQLLTSSASLNTLNVTNVNFDKLIAYVSEYLIDPGKAWEKASIFLKRKLQVFYFAKGIVFDGFESRTPKVCMIFKVKSSFLASMSHKVDFSSPIKNTPEMPIKPCYEKYYVNTVQNDDITYHETKIWNDIAHELVYLGKLKDGKIPLQNANTKYSSIPEQIIRI